MAKTQDLYMRILVSASTGNVQQAFESIGRLMTGKNGLMGGLAGMGMAAGIFAAQFVFSVGVEAVQAAADFQQQLTQLTTGAGELKSNLDLVAQGVLSMAVDTGTATGDLNAALYMVNSAGYIGAQGLDVLRSSAEAARIENANLATVANVVVTVLTDYNMKGDQATNVTNGLIAAVKSGRLHLQTLSTALGNVLPTAANLGIKFPEVAAAISTMTNAGMTAQRASQNLNSMLTALSSPSDVAVKAMKSVGLSADDLDSTLTNNGLMPALEMINKAVGDTFPKNSVDYNEALKHILGGLTGLRVDLSLTGDHLADFQAGIKNVSSAMEQGGKDVIGWSDIQDNFNLKMAQLNELWETFLIRVGTQMLPFLTKLANFIMPIVTWIMNLIEQGYVLQALFYTIGAVLAVLAGNLALLLMVLGFIGIAIRFVVEWTIKIVVWTAQWVEHTRTFQAALRATNTALQESWQWVLNLVAAFEKWWSKSHAVHAMLLDLQKAGKFFAEEWQKLVKAFQSPEFHGYLNNIGKAFKDIWNFLVAEFTPVWKTLVSIWNTQVTPALKALSPLGKAFAEMWREEIVPMIKGIIPAFREAAKAIHESFGPALHTLLPVLKLIGAVIGIVIITVLGLLLATIVGIVSSLAPLINGLLVIINDIINMFKGLYHFFMGFFKLLIDLFTGNFKNLGNDLNEMFSGLYHAFQAFCSAIWHIITTLFAMIVAFVQGWVAAIIAWFTHLSDKLVGHSIIPDMVNSITAWFKNLPAWVWKIIEDFVAGVVNRFDAFKNRAISVIQSLVQGIKDAFSSIPGFFQGIGSNMWNGIRDGINWIINGINTFINDLNGMSISIPSAKIGDVTIGGGTLSFPHINNIPLLAMGGTISHAGAAIVGERGPELLQLPAGARVTPLQQAGHSYVFHITVNGVVGDKRDIVDWIERELSRRLRQSGVFYANASGGRSI